jgi:hypothetical protein
MRPAAYRVLLLPWVAAGIASAFGAWWRDCVLVASGALLALHAFYAGMDRSSPWEAMRGALRCWVAGLLSILGAVGLLVWVAVVVLIGWSAPAHALGEALAVLSLAAVLAWFGRADAASTRYERAVAGTALVAAAGAEIMVRDGIAYAPCAFAILVAVSIAWLGWHLAHDLASILLRASERH